MERNQRPDHVSPGMAVEIAFRELCPSVGAERELHRNIARLARAFPELTRCRVLIEPMVDAADCDACHVRIDLTVPRVRLEVEAPAADRSAEHDFTTLVRGAFARARRELALRRRRRAVLPAHHLF